MTLLAQTLLWGAQHWLPIAAATSAVFLALLAWGYWRAGSSPWLRLTAATLKALGVLILIACLLEPLLGGTRAKPGANLFIVLTDTSQSMTLRDRDRDSAQPRAEQVAELLSDNASWRARLGQDFDLRTHTFDSQLRSADAPTTRPADFDGRASNLVGALQQLARRYHGRPLAGVILLSDGVATDAADLDRLLGAVKADRALPPIYPILIGGRQAADDIGIERIGVTQTNFEDAPVTVTAHATGTGYAGKTVTAQLQDATGKMLQEQKVTIEADGKPIPLRFQLKPETAGISFYRVVIAPDRARSEATPANNTRLLAVDRGRGPYRILYVAGRPNWEFKFLQRALYDDDQITLIGLLRIARREPKFNFLSRAGERSNPLYRGFDPATTQPIEEYDKPVLVRAGKLEDGELQAGFPTAAEELYKYHAIILDDLESEFFTQDQMQRVKDFVRQRGGGLLMLGGQESFHRGKFERTPIGDLLPVYADEVLPAPPAPGGRYRLALTREGWLEPWVRLRAEESDESKRLAGMPAFQTLNPIRGIKPGATVLARVQVEGSDQAIPALVEQRFGAGRVGALLIGDLWRWGLRRPADDTNNDLEKSWRQTARWLVADVPQRVEVAVSPATEDAGSGNTRVTVDVRDPTFAALDNAQVTVKITGPDDQSVELTAEPSPARPGRYEAPYVARQDGAYRAQVTARAPDGSDIAQVETGWTSDPAADEFQTLRPNRELLARLAAETGGEVVQPADLDTLVARLPTRHAQITEPFIQPLWHQSWVFGLAILCLTAEWGLRRWRGLP